MPLRRRRAVQLALASWASVGYVPQALALDLRAALAKQLQARPGDFVLNLPPRTGCLPGSIFTEDLRLPIARTTQDDQDLTMGPAFSLDAELGNSAEADGGATFAPLFGFLASHKSSGTAAVHIAQAHTIEMLGGDLKRRLLASEPARKAADRGTDPYIVFRAYQGQVGFRLARAAGTEASAWAKVKADAVQVNVAGKLATDSDVLFTIPDPIVFAFEVMKATFVTTHLGGGGADTVSLRPIEATQFHR